MASLHGSIKTLGLGLLWFFGLSLIAVSLIKGPPGSPNPFLALGFPIWGGGCILAALVWMYWDHKRRRLTPDEELEKLLLDVAKCYRHTRSLEAVAEEYRQKGASNDTLEFIRAAPGMLRARGAAKIELGLQLLVTGIVLMAGSYWLSRAVGFSHYEVTVGAIGGGVGFIFSGLRQRRAFPKDDVFLANRPPFGP